MEAIIAWIGKIIDFLLNLFVYLGEWLLWAISAVVNALIKIFGNIIALAADLLPNLEIP